MNALNHAEVTKVVMGRDERRLKVVVPEEQLSLAIGSKGPNVWLGCESIE
jgi:N utilization substance protein A